VVAFCPTTTSLRRQRPPQKVSFLGTTSTALCSTYNDNSSSSSIKRSRIKNAQDITLYDILGASPKDTPEQLKRRYQTLVKSLHPDVNRNNDKYRGYELSEINAAWEVLGDKKSRLRYDRELQAREFTQGVEALVGLGIQTAIPFLKKTADTTVKAYGASTKVAQESAEQAKFAYELFELDQKSRSLEQKAAAEMAKAQRLQKELESLPNKRVDGLQQNKAKIMIFNSDTAMTSTEAQRILKTFQVTSLPAPLSVDLQALYETEQEHKESAKSRQMSERAAQQAQRKLESARLAELQAQKRLEEAQKALSVAQQNHAEAQTLQSLALAEETKAEQTVQKVEKVLQTKSDKVRAGLYQQQESFIDRRCKELKLEQSELEASAKKLQKEADDIRKQARQLEKQQQ
jgi:curved DNA-binding protein CbpA